MLKASKHYWTNYSRGFIRTAMERTAFEHMHSLIALCGPGTGVSISTLQKVSGIALSTVSKQTFICVSSPKLNHTKANLFNGDGGISRRSPSCLLSNTISLSLQTNLSLSYPHLYRKGLIKEFVWHGK